MKYIFDWEKYADIARKTAAEGCVLLRNEGEALPIKRGESVSVFGRIQLHYYKSGTGSGGMINAPYAFSILDGLRACEAVTVNEELAAVYQNWIKENPFDVGKGWAQEPWSRREMMLTEDIVTAAAAKSDIALVILGRIAGENRDNSNTEGSYLLTQEERSMLRLVCEAFRRVAVVLNVGNIIDMKWVDEYKPQAVLYVWQSGMEGGNAVVDILTGKVNPCGKLSDTIAVDIRDYPSTENFGHEERNYYTEDIYVGYRYFETFAREQVKYPFGFGLSYTNFEQKATGYSAYEDVITFKMTVTNTGRTAGKEVVQVYCCPPQGLLGKPVRNLIRFAKTGLLEPGESELVEFKWRIEELASYDDGGYTGNKSCYVLEAGVYEIYAGSDVRSAGKVFEITVKKLQVVEQLSEAVAPVNEFCRIRPYLKCGSSNDRAPEYVVTMETVPVRMNERKEQRHKDCTEEIGSDNQGFTDSFTGDEPGCLPRNEGMCANGISLACSFNTELVRELYETLGLELQQNKIDTILASGMDIHRNPLTGRNYECFSEDPYLTGAMAAAQLRGLKKHGVTGVLKQFSCYNPRCNMQDADSVVSERALREIYLKGFEMAVK